MPTILVSDTNIWIDLREGRVLKEAFSLPYLYAVPDLLFADELKDFEGPELVRLGLVVEPLTADEVGRAEALSQRFTKPSSGDLTALSLALSRDWILVSGDGALRQAAEQAGCEVHGTLWLMDMMVKQGLLTSGEAAERVETMRQSGRRLPRFDRK